MNFYSETLSYVLPNGSRLFLLPRPVSTTVIRGFVATGSIDEGNLLGCGVSHFLEHMLFQGCKGFPGHSVREEAARMGGSLEAYTSLDRTVFGISGDAADTLRFMEMLMAMIRYPELPESRFNDEREVILRECALRDDKPAYRLFDTLLETVYTTHPARCPVIGLKEKVAELHHADLVDYHRRRYTPGRFFMVAVGGFDPVQVYDKFAQLAADWARNDLLESPLPEEPCQYSSRRRQVIYPDPVGRLLLGTPMPRGELRELVAAELLLGVLGMGGDSLLARTLERENQLALDTGCDTLSFRNRDLALISVAAEPGKIRKAESVLLKTVSRLRQSGVSAAELKREQRQRFAERLNDMEDPRSAAAVIGSAVLCGASPEFADRLIKTIESISRDEVMDAGRKLFDESRFSTVIQTPEPLPPPRRKNSGSDRKIPVSGRISGGALFECISDHSIPMVRFSAVLPGGAIFESGGASGTTALTAFTMTGGTGKYDEGTLLGKLDSCGAEFSVSPGSNSMVLSLSVPRRWFKNAFALCKDILVGAAFPEAVFLRERSRLAELLASRNQSPLEAAMEKAGDMLFGEHPYSHGIYGRIADISRLSVGDIRDFYRASLDSSRTVFGFAGDISAAEAEDLAGELTAAIPWSSTPRILPHAPRFTGGGRDIIELDREQSAVVLMVPGVPLGLDFRNHWAVLGRIENGLNARLFKSVREDNALSYHVGMRSMGGFHPGYFAFFALTSPAGAERAEELMNEELRRLSGGGITEQEFEDARRGAAIAAAADLDTASSLLANTMMDLYYGGDPADAVKLPEYLNTLTFGEFLPEVKNAFAPERLAAAVRIQSRTSGTTSLEVNDFKR